MLEHVATAPLTEGQTKLSEVPWRSTFSRWLAAPGDRLSQLEETQAGLRRHGSTPRNELLPPYAPHGRRSHQPPSVNGAYSDHRLPETATVRIASLTFGYSIPTRQMEKVFRLLSGSVHSFLRLRRNTKSILERSSAISMLSADESLPDYFVRMRVHTSVGPWADESRNRS